MKRARPFLPPRNSDALWTLVSDAWDEVALLSITFDLWLSLCGGGGECDQWLKHMGYGLLIKGSVPENSSLKG